MEIIKLGSKGATVVEWQKIIGVNPDGDFGPNTEIATKKYQREHKLVPDGVVGPLTWATVKGKKVKELPPKSPASPTDNWAYTVAKNTKGLTNAERQYVLAVSRGEGFYGKAWNPKPHKLLPVPDTQLAKTSFNWGAVQGSGSANPPFFRHIDHHADGSPYVGKYKRYATAEEGFRDMSRIILNGGKRGEKGAEEIRKAINSGNLKDAVYAQHANGYFELNPSKYLDHVLNNYAQLTSNIEWKPLLSESGKGIIPALLASLTGLGVLSGVSYYLYSKRKKK